MKLHGKIALFGFALTLCIKSIAQCTPDNTIQASQGIFPAQLPPADMNVAYSQVVQFKAPLDTNVYYQPLNTTVAVRVDSIRITDVLGLPPGITYQCNNASCMINGGEVGCLIIQGTTNEGGGHPLQVIIRTSAKIKGTPPFPDIPQVSIDTNTRYDLFVNWPTGLVQLSGKAKMNVYPNPASHMFNIEADFGSEKDVQATLYDIAGRAVLSQALQSVSGKQSLSVAGLNNGVYFLTVISSVGTRQEKIVVRNNGL